MKRIETGFSLGSNLGNRLRRLGQAKTRILLEPDVVFAGQSAVYETEPVEVNPDYQHLKFLNAVLVVESPYTAEEWLEKIKKIEDSLHRVRSEDRNAPRTIDVDLLYCGSRAVKTGQLEVPHPRWEERRFVVQPLADVRPDLILPGTNSPVRVCLEQLSDSSFVRLFSGKW